MLVWQAAQSVDEDRGKNCMTGVIDIFTETEGSGNADLDLLVYAMTFVNKILYAITGK